MTLNEESRAFYARRSDSKIHVIPNFAISHYRDNPTQGDYWLYVGRLTAEKGVDWLLAAIPPYEKLVIAGAGPLEEAVTRSAGAQTGRIIFLGQLKPEEVQALYHGAKALIIPSLWSEGIPSTALEALATGLPLIVSDACATARDLTRGGAGEVFKASDEVSFRGALERVSTNWSKYSNQAAHLHAMTFSQESWLQAMSTVYESI